MFIHVFISKIYPKCFKPDYERELFTLQDGQQIALDWQYPKRFNPNNRNHTRPIALGLYGITGNNESLNIMRYCKLLTQRLGFPSVVIGRRGHETDIPLVVPKMAIFGLQDDLHDVLLHIHQKYPHSQFVLLG